MNPPNPLSANVIIEWPLLTKKKKIKKTQQNEAKLAKRKKREENDFQNNFLRYFFPELLSKSLSDLK